jgi:diacylglycerol kinase (ATP)
LQTEKLMKAFIVLNPSAGKNAREPIREAISRYFSAAHFDYEIYETVKGDDPGDIVRKRLKDGLDLVVAAGGDGTVSAVIDGLTGSSVPLGIIPAGTGNLIAREINVPLEIEEAAALITGAHKSKKIDAMRIDNRIYLLNVSLGISASVVSGTTSKNKSRFGRLAYLSTAILKVFTFRNRYLTVAIDGKTQRYRAIEATISNCGILSRMLYPKGLDVSIDDGHVDVWILSAKTIQDYPLYLFQMITRKPARHLSHFSSAAKSISIRSNIPLPVQADGDIIGKTPVEIEVLAGAFTVLVPEKPPSATNQGLDRDRVMAQYLSGYTNRAAKIK